MHHSEPPGFQMDHRRRSPKWKQLGRGEGGGKDVSYKGKTRWKQQHSGKKSPQKWLLNSFYWELQCYPCTPILEKIVQMPDGELNEGMLQILSEATRGAKSSPLVWCHQKRKKISLCSPNEVFQKWIAPLSAKKKISYERLNLKWSPF